MPKKKVTKPIIEAIPFANNNGAVMLLPGDLTLKDLAQMGVTRIRFEPKGNAPPLEDGWWRDVDGKKKPI